jgi:hypothetical protein
MITLFGKQIPAGGEELLPRGETAGLAGRGGQILMVRENGRPRH